jgi:signal transduction histidine kinase
MPGLPDGGPSAGAKAQRRFRAASAVTALALTGVVVASSLITHHVIRDQERLILLERTGEAAAVLGSAFSGSQATLQLLGTLARSDHGDGPKLFAEAARSVTTAGSETWLVTAQRKTDTKVIAAAGPSASPGEVLSGDSERLAHRALSSTGLISGLVREGSARWLAFALGGAAGPGTVVWEEAKISPATPVSTAASAPFGNLNVAIYVSARPSPSTLVLTTTRDLPLAGLDYRFRVGTDTWLVVAQSPRPVVGTLAQDMPWIVLIIGGLAIVLITAFIETLGRRRDYAAALVEERTASLHTAMVDLQETQTQLVRQEKLAAVGQLASTVGHELRNPLGVLMNLLYLMENAAGDDPGTPIRRHITTAKREISAATLIVSDLLDYSAGRPPILAAVDVGDLVNEALSVAPPPQSVHIVHRGNSGALIEADHDQIRQALLNLITNGYDAMPDGGELTVTVAPEADAVQITVTDTGAGMDSETRQALFTPFFTRKARGIGLGLAVTKRIIEAHHGTITVESTPQEGSSFTITVPAATTMAEVAR